VLAVDRCEIIGYGDSPLARFLRGRLLDLPFGLTVAQARIYTTYFISQAKKYDGQYVGGPTDVYSIEFNWQKQRGEIRIVEADQTPGWEDTINLFQRELDVLFHRLCDANNPVGCEAALKEFDASAARFNNWATLAMPLVSRT
jgi:hypothetical protein